MRGRVFLILSPQSFVAYKLVFSRVLAFETAIRRPKSTVFRFSITKERRALSPDAKALHALVFDEDSNELLAVEESRRKILSSIILAATTAATSCIHNIPQAQARNLPLSTAANPSKTGTVETLIPLVQLYQVLQRTQSILLRASGISDAKNVRVSPTLLNEVEVALSSSSLRLIPWEDETKFKQLFDAYSTPVSYKQTYMDQNAFLVYYTQGYDGPGRQSIENSTTPNEKRQTLQYGARNDVWTAVDGLFSELGFAASTTSGGKEAKDGSSVDDILGYVNDALYAMEQYLDVALEGQVEEAKAVLVKQEAAFRR